MLQLSPEIQHFIREHQNDDVRILALQAKKYPGIDMPLVINQIAGRRAAAQKLPSWYAVENILYPPHLSLEQCSSEVTARYKAGLLKGRTLADLTGGFGIDCAFLSEKFSNVTYIERQEELCRIATHNFSALGLHHIKVKHQDSVAALQEMDAVDCIFIDPARRDARGGKTILVSDCEPDVEALEPLLLEKAGRIMVKLSPMLDLSLALRSLPHTVEVHIVSVQNECKELLLIVERSEKSSGVPIRCVNFTHSGMQEYCFTHNEEASAIVNYTSEVARYLYEPNASVLKAGAFRSISSMYGIHKLHPNSHLYTSDKEINYFPGRCFQVEEVSTIKDKNLLKGLSQANITTRNFPLSVADLRKRLKLKDGGDIYLFATTLADGKKVLVKTKKVSPALLSSSTICGESLLLE